MTMGASLGKILKGNRSREICYLYTVDSLYRSRANLAVPQKKPVETCEYVKFAAISYTCLDYYRTISRCFPPDETYSVYRSGEYYG